MSSVVESVSVNRLNSRSLLGFDLLFGVVPLLLLAPLLALEFQSLWHRPGMAFFPIPIFVVVGLAVWHASSPRLGHPQRVLLARGLFLVGVGIFGACVWQLSTWLAHFSLVLLFASWALERLGSVAWPRVMGWSALLATSMRLPGEVDSGLQNWIVRQSSAILGYILDGLAIPYLILADMFNMRGLEFSISECCNGVYSIHALASAVVLLLLLTHRSLLVGTISLLTLPLWAIVQQVLLLLAVVFLKHFSERDATGGLDHTLIELAVFVVVVSCCWASMWFMAKMFLPVPAADSQFESEFLILNSIVCWPQPDPFASGGPPNQLPEESQQRLMIASHLMGRVSRVGAIGLIVLGLLSTHRWVYGGFANDSIRLPSIHAQLLASTEWTEFLPEVFDHWNKMKVSRQILRTDGNDRAAIQWDFGWQGQILQLSVTLPFKGHPRLATKYEALGWRVLTEQAKQFVPSAQKPAGSSPESEPPTAPVEKETWTELSITNDLGGQARAIVAYHPLHELAATRTKPSKFPPQPILEYQVLLFCESGEELTMSQLSELYNGFYLANEHLRKEVEPRLRELLGDVQ